MILLPSSLEHSCKKPSIEDVAKKDKLEILPEVGTTFFVFWLVARKPLETLEPIILLETIRFRKKSYLEVLGWIKHSKLQKQ